MSARDHTRILAIGVVFLFVLNVYLYYIYNLESSKLIALKKEYEPFLGLQDMSVTLNLYPYNSLFPSPEGVHIVSSENIEFAHCWTDNSKIIDYQPYTAIYSSQDNLTLRMTLNSLGVIETDVHLSIQKGRAFLNESGMRYKPVLVDFNTTCWQSPILWEVYTNEMGNYTFTFPSQGWYTISLVGPIKFWEGGRISFNPPIWVDDTRVKVDFIHIWLDLQILKGSKTVLFSVHKHNVKS